MAAKLMFLTSDEVCSIQLKSEESFLTLKIETQDFDAELDFDYETALALRNQIDLVLKTIEPSKPKK